MTNDPIKDIRVAAMREVLEDIKGIRRDWDCGHPESRLCDCHRDLHAFETVEECIEDFIDKTIKEK